MLIALIAAACMVVQDVLEVIKIQADAANRGWLAGMADTAMWLFAIQSTSITVLSHGSNRVLVMALVSGANLGGTKLGQVTGKWLLGRRIKEDES